MFSVDLSEVTLRYRHQSVFENLSLSLPAATCTCILGPSGVGKSSLLHLLADLPMGENTSLVKKLQVSDGLPLMGRVALMAQQDNLLPWCSVIDNALLGYRLRQTVDAPVRERACVLLQQVGFSADDLCKNISALSGGMRQRVALVRTLLEDKALVLMDEPFSALDSITRFQLQALSAQLLRHKTVLLITHDPLEALRMADHIYVLKGAPARLSAFTVALTPPPRALDATLLQQQAALWALLAEAT